MPFRTIKDAFFMFADPEGRRVWAQRAETVDIPEGPDLERGDATGAFTADGSEPPAPAGSFIPEIDIQWTPEEWNDWVDAGKITEIIEKLNKVNGIDRGFAAACIIQAENGRGERARPDLLAALAPVADTIGVRTSDPSSNNDISLLSDADLATWVGRNSPEAVLAAVGSNVELAQEVEVVEKNGQARKRLLFDLGVMAAGTPAVEVVQKQAEVNGQALATEAVQPSTESDGDPLPPREDSPTEEAEASAAPAPEDLADFVASSNIPTVVERAGSDAELAREFLTIEQARGDKTRAGLVDKLNVIIDNAEASAAPAPE